MIIIGANKGVKGAGRIIKFLARRGGLVGRSASRFDSWRTRRQWKKRGFL